jgi:aspartate kinase
MKVFKFGGASVKSVENIKNVAAIVEQHRNEPLVIIVSAMGKTTNALEKVVAAFFEGRKEDALKLFKVVKNQHLTTAKYLLVTHYNNTLNQLINFFTEAEWLLHDRPVREYDYYYDQVVCIGELLSTCIVSAWLNEKGIANRLLDVRDILRTDNNFRDAAVDWEETGTLLKDVMNNEQFAMNNEKLTVNNEEKRVGNGDKTGDEKELNLVEKSTNAENAIIITQGFIGSTSDNESTTLGREGSDYSAAIFANLLNAESLTIWKDVEGVMSADPKSFFDAEFISSLSYREVIEMAYYGAQVIHPKTIKPLQNKNIPLIVKSFINPEKPGTIISRKSEKYLPPIKIIKPKQVLIHLQSQDFSFVGEKPLSQLYGIFAELHVVPNLLQTGAITIQVCLDDHPEKIDQLAATASNLFNVQLQKELTLLTIRHFTEEILDYMLQGKTVELMQKTKETVQVVYQ